MKPRRRHLLIVTVALALLLPVFAILLWPRKPLPAVVPQRVDNTYAGLTKDQIIATLGTPDAQWPGHYGAPESKWATQHEPCITFTYQKWGGTLYLSIEQQNGQWVCFCSTWLPKGGVF